MVDRDHPLAQGLMGFWLLAGDVRNLAGNSHAGSMVGAPSIGMGLLGPAVNLAAASTQYINIPDPAATLSAPAMSYVAWIKPASFPNSYNAIVHKGDGGSYFECFVKSNGKIAIYTPNSNYDGNGIQTLSAGTTYQFAATFDSATVGVAGYINSVVDTPGALPAGTPITLSTTTLSIGRDSVTAGRNFDGLIGPVGVWSRALTANEIAWLYAEPFVMLRPLIRKQYYGLPGAAPPSVSLDMWHQPASQPYRVRAEMIPY